MNDHQVKAYQMKIKDADEKIRYGIRNTADKTGMKRATVAEKFLRYGLKHANEALTVTQ